MAGIFGFFDYTKEGPGIPKNGPKKKTFVVFFETIGIDLLYTTEAISESTYYKYMCISELCVLFISFGIP